LARAQTQARSRAAWLRFLSLVAAFAPAPALAGAWLAEGGREITSSVAGQRDEVSFFETAGYWEIPLSPDNSFVAAPWVEQNYDTPEGWRGEATFGVKHVLARGRDSILSLQAGALWMSYPGAECGEGGAEVRLLGGMNLQPGTFVNVEARAKS
jgi:hypothetical protein